MYLDDLSAIEEDDRRIAIGWLEGERPFHTGATSVYFQKKLAALCKEPVCKTRGFHTCEFCGDPDLQGNGEIHIPWKEGKCFVAPAMVDHYVVAHRYRPPDEFINAVMKYSPEKEPVSKLMLAMRRMSISGNPDGKEAFLSCMRSGKIWITPDQKKGVLSNETISMGMDRSRNRLIFVYADIPFFSVDEKRIDYVDIDAGLLIRYAIDHQAGIYVMSGSGRNYHEEIPLAELKRINV